MVRGRGSVNTSRNPLPMKMYSHPTKVLLLAALTGCLLDREAVAHPYATCLTNNAAGVAGVTCSSRLMPVRVLARIVNVNDACIEVLRGQAHEGMTTAPELYVLSVRRFLLG